MCIRDRLFTSQEERRYSKFIKLAIQSTYEALKSANLLTHKSSPSNPEIDITHCNMEKFGCVIGSGIGSISDIYSTTLQFQNGKKISPYFVPKILTNMAAGNVSIKFNLRGLSHSVSTACATGNNSIGDAYNFIRLGMQDICVAGASEASIHPLSLAGFLRAKSITTDGISRPFDLERSGFVLGEGAGMVVLESLEHAKKRNAKIFCEIKGYGLSSDAYHITSPPSDGNGARRAMDMAINSSSISRDEIDYVNAHATSTPVGDITEVKAIYSSFINENIFDKSNTRTKPLYVSSNKGSIGHLLGAAGAVESIFTIMSLREKIIPHTLNLAHPIEEVSSELLELVMDEPASPKQVNSALCNSFGFGGVNTALLFSKYNNC